MPTTKHSTTAKTRPPTIRRRTRQAAPRAPEAANNAPQQRLSLEYLPIWELLPHSKTLRKHSEQQLAAIMGSLRAFGLVTPLLVDANNVIVDGHAVLEAAKRLDFSEVPVVRLSQLSPAQIRACRVGLNKLAEGAAWDAKELAFELFDIAPALQAHDIEPEAIGFSPAEFDLLLAPQQTPPADVMPGPATGPAVSRAGDLWLLGPHRLLCGDALNDGHFQQLMAGEKARMSFTDPPYNLKVEGVISGLGKVKHREFAMASGEMTREQFTDFLATYMGNCAAHAVDGSVHFACMDWRHIAELLAAGDRAYNKLLNLVVWNKTNAGMGSMYRSQHELIGVFKAGTARHTNNFQLGQTGRHRSNVWTVPGANSFGPNRTQDLADHPTVKPTILVMEAIRDVSRRGEIVLDCFCGSGTTILAAERTGRVCRAIELDPRYVDLAVHRWQALSGTAAVLHGDGRNFEELAACRAAEGEHGHD
ncbi:site-specific DNA-methyltransferase [Devosia sp. Naph2]|uniref:site-specific DNA-methyltransferase n=1 Tax=Devosia polycyclovorans TaxID=3345148 RepID=UPI0035CEB707